MNKKMPLTTLENDVLEIFVNAVENRVRKSGAEIAKDLKEKHSDITGHNVTDVFRRLESMDLVQRVNGTKRPDDEKKGLPRVTRKLNKVLFKSVEIEIVAKRKRKSNRKKDEIIEKPAPAVEEKYSAKEYQPDTTLEEVEKFLLEKDAHITSLKERHATLLTALHEAQAKVEVSKREIEEREFEVLEEREVVQRALDSFEALKKLLPEKK